MTKLLFGLLGTMTLALSANAANLKVYSTRSQAALQPVLDKFIKDNPGTTFTWAKAANWDLMTELEKATEGDVYLTKDLVYLNEASQKGLLRKFDTTNVAKNIPAFMIDKGQTWTGLGLRARTMIYNPDLVNPSELSTYEDLASPEWQARMCLRTSLSSYSVGFTSFLIAHLGREATVDVLKGWVDNTAIDPTIGDELLLESISAGICGVGVINTHYFAAQLKANPKLNAKVFFANQGTTGTHVNGSGVGILKTTTNAALAQKFVEFLTRTDIQTELAKGLHEYPANVNAETPATLLPFGKFKRDETSWTDLGKYLKLSRELFIEADYN